jgi:hypothetical protein
MVSIVSQRVGIGTIFGRVLEQKRGVRVILASLCIDAFRLDLGVSSPFRASGWSVLGERTFDSNIMTAGRFLKSRSGSATTSLRTKRSCSFCWVREVLFCR